jgi:transposase
MRTESYPSDVTDAQWALIAPLIPVYPGGRKGKGDADIFRQYVRVPFFLFFSLA